MYLPHEGEDSQKTQQAAIAYGRTLSDELLEDRVKALRREIHHRENVLTAYRAVQQERVYART